MWTKPEGLKKGVHHLSHTFTATKALLAKIKVNSHQIQAAKQI